MIREYEADLKLVLANLTPDTLQDCIQLVRLPEQIRGYGPVKDQGLRQRTATATATERTDHQ